MKSFIKILTIVTAALALPISASADPNNNSRMTTKRVGSYMRIFGPANPPYGFVRFCSSNPSACQKQDFEIDRVQVTPERLSELDDINRYVNSSIQPVTDMEIYGVTEHWTLPIAKGDCEDYALLKRQLLIERGWPASALLLTVVRDELGDGHAVLTIRTAQGDYILDNKDETVRMWTKTPYKFLMRQSYLNPLIWVSLDARTASRGEMPISGTANSIEFLR